MKCNQATKMLKLEINLLLWKIGHSHNAIFHWNFQKYLYLYAIID